MAAEDGEHKDPSGTTTFTDPLTGKKSMSTSKKVGIVTVVAGLAATAASYFIPDRGGAQKPAEQDPSALTVKGPEVTAPPTSVEKSAEIFDGSKIQVGDQVNVLNSELFINGTVKRYSSPEANPDNLLAVGTAEDVNQPIFISGTESNGWFGYHNGTSWEYVQRTEANADEFQVRGQDGSIESLTNDNFKLAEAKVIDVTGGDITAEGLGDQPVTIASIVS